MKKKSFFITAVGLFLLMNVKAQAPEGFVKGSVTLADGSSADGYIKENMKKAGNIIFISEKSSDKKIYNSTEVNAVAVDGANYVSVKGDFFKVICNGKISFLQKASNAAGKTIYNGVEAIILPGTEGKTGDYFSYTANELTLINKKTMDAFIGQLSNCTAAVEKAKSVNGDIAALADAVVIYNSYNK